MVAMKKKLIYLLQTFVHILVDNFKFIECLFNICQEHPILKCLLKQVTSGMR